ncbi:MAG: hypothetical protein NZ480_09310 [Bdellovibrionaceae bacterium]|nr:hypothetical protein [Pseudobdellovibrionaceae bacterium]MDW8189746.1 hypothetical protein [Pseudobdellovibrionaceae bacterium]
MTKFWIRLFFIVAIVLISKDGLSKKIYVYHRLYMKNVEAMEKAIYKKLEEGRKDRSKVVVALTDATQMLLSRPDHDHILAKLVPTLFVELRDRNVLEKVIDQFFSQAFDCLKHNIKKCSDEAQVTYLIALENFVRHFKKFSQDEPAIIRFLEKLSEARIEISAEAHKASKVRIPIELKNPSEVAKQAIAEVKSKKDK